MQKLFVLLLFLFSLPMVDADLIINEIMYNLQGDDGGHEWIEIYNNENEEIDLEDWRFYEADMPHRLSLTQGDNEIISENEYIIIANDAEIFLQDYENFEGTVLDSSFSLSNAGEYLALKDPEGNIVDELTYSSDWGNREGYSIELINPTLDNDEGINWNSSQEESGTPGTQNSIFAIIEDEVQFTQQILLRDGWNLISSNVIPINTELEDIFSSVVELGYLEIVKDSQGRFYNPRTGFNNIPEWNPYGAYWVNVNWRSNLIISGEEKIEYEIPLRQGWNYVAYPLDRTHSAEDVIENIFNPLGNNLVMVKDQDGRFYNKRYGYNNIQEFIPGRGYQIKVNEEAILDFSNL